MSASFPLKKRPANSNAFGWGPGSRRQWQPDQYERANVDAIPADVAVAVDVYDIVDVVAASMLLELLLFPMLLLLLMSLLLLQLRDTGGA